MREAAYKCRMRRIAFSSQTLALVCWDHKRSSGGSGAVRDIPVVLDPCPCRHACGFWY